MIQRRTFISGLCGFLAIPFTIVPTTTKNPLAIEPDVDAQAGSIVFTIQGWNGAELEDVEKAGKQIVPLYLPNSWRSSWM